jgi:hypothetical protein
MIEVLRCDLYIIDFEYSFEQVVIVDGRAEFIRRDPKVSVLHLPG